MNRKNNRNVDVKYELFILIFFLFLIISLFTISILNYFIDCFELNIKKVCEAL